MGGKIVKCIIYQKQTLIVYFQYIINLILLRPIYLSYLFTFQVVSEIRTRLDFSTTFKPLLSSTPHQTVQRNRDKR